MDVSEKKKELIQYMEKHPEGNFEIQAERLYKRYQRVAEKFAEDDRIKVECTPYKKIGFFCRVNGIIKIFLKIKGKWKTYVTVRFYLFSPSNVRAEFYNEIEYARSGEYWILGKQDDVITKQFYEIMGNLNGSKSPKEPDKSL